MTRWDLRVNSLENINPHNSRTVPVKIFFLPQFPIAAALAQRFPKPLPLVTKSLRVLEHSDNNPCAAFTAAPPVCLLITCQEIQTYSRMNISPQTGWEHIKYIYRSS